MLIVGDSVGSAMNVIPALGVYAAMMRRAGKTRLDYPGGVGRVAQAVDADLLARAIAWSGEAATARNEIFNVTNGDVFVWPNVWPAIADALGFAAGEHVPLRARQARSARRRRHGPRSARAHGLRSGTLKEFVGLSFEYADYTMGYGRTQPGPPAIVSTIKLMQAGFCEVMDTEAMFPRPSPRCRPRSCCRRAEAAENSRRRGAGGDAPAAGPSPCRLRKATADRVTRALTRHWPAAVMREEETKRDALSRRPAPSVTLDERHQHNAATRSSPRLEPVPHFATEGCCGGATV